MVIAAVFCLIPAGSAAAAAPKREVKEGNRLFERGDFVASQEKYQAALTKEPESDIINFNLGAALYKEKEYEEAVEHFQKVFLSEDEDLKEKAYYNLGNTLYRLGLTLENSAIEEAMSTLENSLKQYERAMEIDKEDEDTLNNYAFVEKELKRLKVKQQQQGQKGQNKDGQQQDQQPGAEGDQNKEGEQQGQRKQEGKGDQSKEEERQQEQQQGAGDEQQQQEGRQQEPKDEQRKEGQSNQQSSASAGEGKDQDQKQAAQGQGPQDMTKQEAKMLLESYQQSEEPQGLLNIQLKTQDGRPVEKDW